MESCWHEGMSSTSAQLVMTTGSCSDNHFYLSVRLDTVIKQFFFFTYKKY